MTNESLHVVCPHCDAVNRIPAARLGEGAKCGKCHRPLFSGHPIELTGANFQKHVTRSDIPLLVDFWAPWCGPCKVMAPAFEQATRQIPWRARGYGHSGCHTDPNLGVRGLWLSLSIARDLFWTQLAAL